MIVFEIIGGVFVLLFLAAAMTGIEGADGRWQTELRIAIKSRQTRHRSPVPGTNATALCFDVPPR
jgi:hypothetical protein